MDNSALKRKILIATKWSTITEIVAKLIVPITNMILARILAPEAFGVVATITMIISFADLFTDAGFQKYLVQKEFPNDKEKYQYTNVAFWTNFVFSLMLWLAIVFFSETIAKLVGNPGLGEVIAISCIQLPITSFSSIQMALYRRDFDFKTLFMVRIISICIPFIITIPLAVLGYSYWALIIGVISGNLVNAVILTIKSKWKPKWFYNFNMLKKMLSFSIWSLIEAIAIWLTAWIDIFIIGNLLSEYYLGIYMASTTLVNSIMSLITASTIPILFSALSRLQHDNLQFNRTFLNMQRIVSIFVLPLGVGLYIYSDLAVKVFLGDQWSDASSVVGTWALTSAITIVLGNYCSEVYRAKGKPKLSFLAQLLHLIVLVPICLVSGKYGFWIIVFARSWIRLEAVLVHFFLMKFVIKFPLRKIFINVAPSIISAMIMGITGFLLKEFIDSIAWEFISIFVCIIVYFIILLLFKGIRKDIYSFFHKYLKK